MGGFGNTRKGLIQPLEREGELVVFHAHEVKDSGLKVLRGNWIGDCFIANGVGFAVGMAGFPSSVFCQIPIPRRAGCLRVGLVV